MPTVKNTIVCIRFFIFVSERRKSGFCRGYAEISWMFWFGCLIVSTSQRTSYFQVRHR
jgi:hypothetical protein